VRLEINGTDRDVTATTLAGVIDDVLGTRRGSAAVVDGTVVPRSLWASFALREGQRLELIMAVQGG
jgi:thiamine biosynthesis protein ThiS